MSDEHLWAIVLAAGNGARVSAMTATAAGAAVPKQYCSFGRETPMLRWALDRVTAVVPPDRVLVVVAEEHRALWEAELQDLPPANVVVQPGNRGTAAGLLLPFLQVFLHRDPGARVLVLPSDHYVAREPVLRQALIEAVGLPRLTDDSLMLLGMTPSDFDPEYGWILPAAASAGPARRVTGFVEKPDRETAGGLVELGALLNTFILVADAGALLALYERALPALLLAFLRALRARPGPLALKALYDSLPVTDFSRDLLERWPRHLRVMTVPDCGWSDLGTPARIQLFLSRVAGSTAAAAGPLRVGPARGSDASV